MADKTEAILDAIADPIHEATCRDNSHPDPESEWPCNEVAAVIYERLKPLVEPIDDALVMRFPIDGFDAELQVMAVIMGSVIPAEAQARVARWISDRFGKEASS